MKLNSRINKKIIKAYLVLVSSTNPDEDSVFINKYSDNNMCKVVVYRAEQDKLPPLSLIKHKHVVIIDRLYNADKLKWLWDNTDYPIKDETRVVLTLPSIAVVKSVSDKPSVTKMTEKTAVVPEVKKPKPNGSKPQAKPSGVAPIIRMKPITQKDPDVVFDWIVSRFKRKVAPLRCAELAMDAVCHFYGIRSPSNADGAKLKEQLKTFIKKHNNRFTIYHNGSFTPNI